MHAFTLPDEQVAEAAVALCHALQPYGSNAPAPRTSRRGKVWTPLNVPGDASAWAARVRAYNWENADHATLEREIDHLFRGGIHLGQRLSSGGWLKVDYEEAVQLSKAIFTWGGIRSHRSITPVNVHSVFTDALRLAANKSTMMDGPMSSGWTKVAAFATRHLDGGPEMGHTPQVIWDSRVANGIRKLVDGAATALSPEATSWIRATMRQVRGRGGERLNLQLPEGWNWANTPKQKWEAQAAGSRIIRHMRDALNRAPEVFGPMPQKDAGLGLWTSWGVGLALFVEGY